MLKLESVAKVSSMELDFDDVIVVITPPEPYDESYLSELRYRLPIDKARELFIGAEVGVNLELLES